MATIQPAPDADFAARARQKVAVPPEILSELGRATTAYYEAAPDKLEQARREYEEVLRRFKATSDLTRR